MRNYFCGWHFRCQSEQQTLAIIPSFHKTKQGNFCAIQFITETEAFNVQFPYSDYHKVNKQIMIADNRFSRNGITLDIHPLGLCVSGSLRFRGITPIRYDIMGPFHHVPFMQCRHSVFSMRHMVDGEIILKGTRFVFRNAIGHIEGERRHSFPRKYVQTQCSFSDGLLMLSIADILFGAFRFTGVIGVVLLKGKEYRIATYLGATAVKITLEEIIVRQGNYILSP